MRSAPNVPTDKFKETLLAMMNAQRAREQHLFQRGWSVRLAEGWALQLHFARGARDLTEFTGSGYLVLSRKSESDKSMWRWEAGSAIL